MRWVSSAESLVALIWASAALATPLIAEPIESRDLEVRQTPKCPSGYESKNGMNFTTYCEMNNPFNDAMAPFLVDTMQECMERCSRYWGKGEGCFGVVWREDKNCWIRNSTVSTKGLTNMTGIHSALVESSDMKALDEDCPAADLSTHSLGSIGYTVHCGKVIGNYDTCWSGYPECLDSPFIGFYHATSLENCLEICIQEHPLCKAVSYNPGLEIGFANCWPKTGFGNTLDTPTNSMGTLHSATITSLDRIDTTCPSSSSYTAAGNKPFELHCGQTNSGTNITSVHTQNITSCLDTCGTTNGCIGILFDSSLSWGYQNCYLQNTTSVISNQASTTYALLSNTPLPSSTSSTAPSSSSSSASSSSSSSSSKAWIAGPVVGGLIGLAIIGAALFLWRRRRNQNGKGGPAQELGASEKSGHYGPAPAYTPMHRDPPSELVGHDLAASEMATPVHGSGESTKYAHKGAPLYGSEDVHRPVGSAGAGGPQELAA